MEHESAASPASASSPSPSAGPSTYFSMNDLIQCLYISGLVKIVMWEEAFANLKSTILDQPSTIVHLYLIIQTAIMHIFDEEPSEIDIFRKKEKEMTLAEILDYFNFQIDDSNFHTKTLDYDTIRLFRELINKSKLTETIELKDGDSGSDDESDSSGDDFDKIFNSFSKSKKSKKSKKVKNTKFEQKFEILKEILSCKINTLFCFIQILSACSSLYCTTTSYINSVSNCLKLFLIYVNIIR